MGIMILLLVAMSSVEVMMLLQCRYSQYSTNQCQCMDSICKGYAIIYKVDMLKDVGIGSIHAAKHMQL